MTTIIRVFLNLVIVFLLLFSVVTIYSEHSSNLKTKISNSIKSELMQTLQVKTSIESVSVKWIGFFPRVYLENISMKDDKNRMILDIPSSEIHLNLFKSLQNKTISTDKIVINNTRLNLTYNKNKIFLNKKNVTPEPNSDKRYFPKIILNNSFIQVTNLSNKQSASFNASNLFASYNKGKIKVHSNFKHNSSNNPITIMYEGEYLDDKVVSKIFISANSVKVPYFLLPEQFQQFKSTHMSLRVWLSLTDTEIIKASGNISSDKLSMSLGNSLLKLDNINSNLLYIKDEQSETLSLMRMNYNLNNIKINNNKIVISKDSKKNIKIYIKKNDNQFFREFFHSLAKNQTNLFKQVSNSSMSDMQLHISERGNLDYFSISIKDLSLSFQSGYSLKDVDANIYGTFRSGLITVNDASIYKKQKNLLDDISGKISYRSKGKSLYFSSTNIINNHGYNISFAGNKISKEPSIKLKFSSNLNKIPQLLDLKDIPSDIEYEGLIESNIYYHDGTFFTKTSLKNLFFNKSDTLYLSADKINLYTTNNFISSKKFDLSFNNKKLTSKILTNSNVNSHKFVLSSNGLLDTSILNSLHETGKIIDGETKIKLLMTYDYTNHTLASFITSNLNGVALDIIKPFNKTREDKTNFVLKYQHYPSIKYPATITLGQHEFRYRNDEEYSYFNIKSPIARGFLKYPNNLKNNNTATGSFEYIDTRTIKSGGVGKSFLNINLKSKHVKTSKAVFDNVHIILSPKDNFISIDKFNFNNLHLKMESSGRWYRNENEKTEINANISSDNLGRALSLLGYQDVLRGGVLNAKFNSQWAGSLEDFSFSVSKGNLNFIITNGQINELDKGTQTIGQVLGLFSISSIPKRLSLDFSDFFSRGLRFDNLKSDVSLNKGIAHTKKMIIMGSFGEMRLSGKSNLIKETHDQTLIFIPDLSSTSLVTGAVLGGPIGAAASIFYDKLLKEFGLDTNKLAGIEYSIKGPWADPEIKVTQSFKPILN